MVSEARGPEATVEALLRAGADPDIVNEAGATPRDLAKRMGAEEIATLFPETH
jgi:ankyrin repeat protein